MLENPGGSDADRQHGAEAELDPPSTPARPGGRFLVLEGVELHKNGARITCYVKLKRPGQSFRGEATELDTNSGRFRAAARATLAAAAQAATSISFGLEGAACMDLFSRRYIIVSVEAAQRRRFILLSGIAAVDAAHSPEEAAAIATLRAIDRWIGHP